jgi:ABC-type transport system involved in cytochrome bd biosynthesis fused ATPase/permease subunit
VVVLHGMARGMNPPCFLLQTTKGERYVILKKIFAFAPVQALFSKARGAARGIARGHGDGQRQRMAIARAILKDTPVILFDEPTSALDRENHALFLDVVKELKKSKTILVVAHKLGSYEIFDNVFSVKNGKLE